MTQFIIVLLSLALFETPYALKIAIDENDEIKVGTGSGSGSGSSTTTTTTALSPSDVVESSGASEGGGEVTTTVTNSAGEKVKVKVKKESKLTWSTATTKEKLTTEGMSAEFSPATLKEIAALPSIPTGASLSISVSKGVVGTPPSAASACDVGEVTVSMTTVAGVTSEVDITGLTNCITVELSGCSGATECATYVDSTDTWKTTGVTGTPTTSCCYTELSKKSGVGGFGGALGDPKATNMAGQKFEILAMGTFQMLSVSSLQENRLTLDATIDRAGEMCGATYIKNVSMTGSWIQEFDGLSDVRIRAASDVPKHRALQLALGSKQWTESKNVQSNSMIKTASAKKLEFSIHDVSIEAKIDAHRIRKNGAKTNQFANFLNIHVNGIKKVQKEGLHLGGLLAYDDHAFAAQTPDNCKPGKLTNLKQKLDPLDTDDQMKFISSMEVQ